VIPWVEDARGVAVRAIVSVVLLAGVLAAPPREARAQGRQPPSVKREVASGQGRRFDDDPSQALTPDAEGTPSGGCFLPRRVRVDLMRPRTTFVPEMLASVETN
jgi:hypothetical protein